MRYNEVLDKMKEIYKAKKQEYLPEEELGNFRESVKIGIPPWKGAFVRLQDKYLKACNLILGKEINLEDKELVDTLLDLANYAVITLCLLSEEWAQKDNSDARKELKYKVGDKVRVKSWKRLIEDYGLKEDESGKYIPIRDIDFTEEMKEFCGKVVTIDAIVGNVYMIAEDDGWCWSWTDEMFEGKV